ncbi:MAG: ABC transporter permease [Silvibacterium sp.]|nr:ABC transporter permease [Silvibacterium sp.]
MSGSPISGSPIIDRRENRARQLAWVERLGQDLHFALRQMRKSRGFAATVVGTLALGIAAATAMFTVVDRVLLRPLPYKDAKRLVYINDAATRDKQVARGFAPYLDIAEWRKWSRTFEGIAFYTQAIGRPFIEGKTDTEAIGFYEISANLFQVLGASPVLGRDFRQDQDGFARNADATSVVISDAIWRSMYNADPAILGQSVRISGTTYVVAGVMPRGFSFPFDVRTPQVWKLVQLSDDDKGRTIGMPEYTVLGRLKPGITRPQAEAELSALQKHIAVGYADPETRQYRSGVWLESYSDSLVEDETRRALEMLLAASGVLWLIACVNATNLLLARATVRQREIALRGALGAGRSRIVQQFLVEGLLLSFLAALAGTGLALLAVRLFAHGMENRLPFPVPAAVDWRVILALLALTLVSALVSSAWPAWLAARSPIEPALKQGGPQSAGARGQNRLRGGLVVLEIAMSLTLLAGCGLLLRTIYTLRHVPLGFRTDHIIVSNLQIPGYKFAGHDMEDNLYGPLIERIRHIPGVQAAGLMSEVPLGATFKLMLTLRGAPGNTKEIVARLNAASPDLQKVFGFKMLAGRFFNEQDTVSSPAALVVNRTFAREFAPNEADLNKVVGMNLWHLTPDRPAHIIGVIDDMHQKAIAEPSEPEVQASLTQVTPKSGFYKAIEEIAMDVAVRTNRSPDAIIPELREVLRQGDPALAGSKFTTMNQVVEDSFGSQTLAAHLLEIFAGSALLLCVAGLYGLLAYVVSQRTREMGVRFALGAQRSDVVWLVMRQATVMLLTGVGLGLGIALPAGRLVRSYLYGVSEHDGWTLAVVAIVLIASGALAAYLPAMRAAEVDPLEALRTE